MAGLRGTGLTHETLTEQLGTAWFRACGGGGGPMGAAEFSQQFAWPRCIIPPLMSRGSQPGLHSGTKRLSGQRAFPSCPGHPAKSLPPPLLTGGGLAQRVEHAAQLDHGSGFEALPPLVLPVGVAVGCAWVGWRGRGAQDVDGKQRSGGTVSEQRGALDGLRGALRKKHMGCRGVGGGCINRQGMRQGGQVPSPQAGSRLWPLNPRPGHTGSTWRCRNTRANAGHDLQCLSPPVRPDPAPTPKHVHLDAQLGDDLGKALFLLALQRAVPVVVVVIQLALQGKCGGWRAQQCWWWLVVVGGGGG